MQKDKFRVGNKKWLGLPKALSYFGLCCRMNRHGGDRTELHINGQLVLYSQWNSERYKRSGWYGVETILCRNCPPRYYKEIVKWLKARWYSPGEAKEFHDRGYWK